MSAYQNSFGPFHFGNLVRDSLARKKGGKKERKEGRKEGEEEGRGRGSKEGRKEGKEKKKEERGKAHLEKETFYNDLKYRT